MSEMKDRIPEHSDTWRGKWESMTSALNSADEGQLNWDRSLGKYQGLILIGIVVAGAIIALASRSVEDTMWLPITISVVAFLIVAVLGGKSVKRLDQASRERQSRWAAFEKWTKDFPSLKDDPPATLDLWKKVLIYGVAFGTAERMIKSGRIPAPVMESAGIGWSYY